MDISRIASGAAQPVAGRSEAVAANAQPRPANPGATENAAPGAPAGAEPVAGTGTPRADLQQLLAQVSRHIDPERRALSFELSEELGRAVVSVYDAETEELIRQIPSETLVRIATTMRELAQHGGDARAASGLLLREQA